MYLFLPKGMALEPLIPKRTNVTVKHVHHYNYVHIFLVYILWKAERKLLAMSNLPHSPPS